MNKILLAIIIGLFVLLSLFSALNESLIYDEIVYVEEGLNHLKYQTFAIDTFNPPLVREITAIPLYLGLQKYLNSDLPNIQVLPARMMVTLFGVVLIVSVYLTAKKYFNQKVALFAAFIFSLEPNFLAHSHYITLDVGFTLFFFLAYFSIVNLAINSNFKNTLIAGLTTGWAFAAKISAVPYLILSVFFTYLIFYKKIKLSINLPKIIFYLIVIGLTVWATYFFQSEVIIAKRVDGNRLSVKLLKYAQTSGNKFFVNALSIAQYQKLPLGNYLATLKNVLLRSQEKSKVFFLGKIYSQSYWYFLPLNILFKTSLPLLILFFYGSLIWLRSHHKKLGLFLIPIIVIISFSSLLNLQPWVRYVLPIYPFAAVVGAYGLDQLIVKKSYKVAIFLVFWLTISTLNSYPHFLTYTNELVLGLGKRYELFADSNLDWGQSLGDFSSYLKRNTVANVSFSYFGRDNGNYYGLVSNRAYGSYKFEQICAFHEINLSPPDNFPMTAISVSNWHNCGYSQVERFTKGKIKKVIADSILIFD